MAQRKQLSAISLNLLYAMSGSAFSSQFLGAAIVVTGDQVVTNDEGQFNLSNDDVELLYQEFVWDLEEKGIAQ